MMLEVDPIAVRRAGRRVSRCAGFRLAAGEMALVTGPNGAGKSSLLRALAGLTPLETGDARVAGRSIVTEREDAQAAIAWAGHLDAVKPQLSVAANLAFWARLRGGDADAALALLGLERIAELPAGYASAGQRRRLGLARLTLEPRPLWLLDEPTVSLDAQSAARFAELLRAHLERGGAAVVVSHAAIAVAPAVEVRLTPPDAAARGAPAAADDDPFLAGSWA